MAMDEPRELVTYLNGQIVPHSQAATALQETDMQPAGGFYDTERTFGGRLFKLRQHLERLYQGLDLAQIDPGLTIDEMEAVARNVLEANRPMLDSSDEITITQVVSLSAAPQEEQSRVNVVVSCQLLDFSAFAKSYVRGVRLITPATYGVPERSPGSAAGDGGQQVVPLMSDPEGNITECQGANFMFVLDGRVKLPDRRNVLPGISMRTVLELSESLGIPVDEDDYTTYHVYLADEAFISSTRYCLLPVDTLNGYRLSNELPGPVTGRLLDAWRDMVGVDFVRQALDHLPAEDVYSPSGDT
jgi:branched-chain amino acid aminotransferase